MKSGELRAHIALIGCNIVWACDYPFYNLLLGRYIAPMAMVCLSLIVAAALSWVPRIWERGERVESSDWGIIILSALLMGVARKTLMMFGMICKTIGQNHIHFWRCQRERRLCGQVVQVEPHR